MMSPPLLTAQDCSGLTHLVLGSGPLAAARCAKSVEAGANPIILGSSQAGIHYTLAKLVEEGRVKWIQREFRDSDLKTLGRDEVDNVVDAVFVTSASKSPLNLHISTLCRRLRIPVNVVDAPDLCSFTLLTTHSDGPLQIGITTSGRGCKLASRIRREIASSLPSHFGDAIDRLGMIRRRILVEDRGAEPVSGPMLEIEEEDTALNQKHTFNQLVQATDPGSEIARNRRMRWLSQICEYWPLDRLASITDADVSAILSAYTMADSDKAPLTPSTLDTRLTRQGRITLAGSGPGHPDLLTRATYNAIQYADFILADKLVPAGVLDLIPRRTPVHIARKFPGNADAAQEELLSLGLETLKQGKHVLRLKQGDPYLYGRGAEELAYFREHGYEAKVLPGVTSALSAPLFAQIPVTHRAVADQILICTGTGRKGKSPDPPHYIKSQTVVFLMALHRLESLVASLMTEDEQMNGEIHNDERKQRHVLWPRETPCAVVERASCPDQRVIRSTLEHVCAAVEEEGSRPPGLLVLGWSCEVLHKAAGQRWVVEDGFRNLDDLGMERGLDIVKELGKSDGASLESTSIPTYHGSRVNGEIAV